jgi:hypothetical protein
MSLTKMQQAGTLIDIAGTNFKMMSPSDDYCVFKSLANLAYYTHDDPRACEQAYAMAKATAVKGETKGHEGSFIRKVCRRLGVNQMTLSSFCQTMNDIGPKNYKNKRV